MSIFKMRPVWATVIEFLDHQELSQLRLVNKWFSAYKNTKKPDEYLHIDYYTYKFCRNSHPTHHEVIKYELKNNLVFNIEECQKKIDEITQDVIKENDFESFIRLITFCKIDEELAFQYACSENKSIFLEYIYSRVKNRNGYYQCNTCYGNFSYHFDEDGFYIQRG